MKFRLAELQAISVKCGLPSTTSRSKQLESLKKFYNDEIFGFSFHGQPILSMDLGLCNLAACEVEVLNQTSSRRVYKILNWNKFDLGLPEIYNPSKYAETVKKFVEKDLLSSFKGNQIFIERQRHRSGSNSAILETIMRLAILEAQLHCFLMEMYKTVPVNPGTVSKFFDLPTGKEKKAAAVCFVKEILLRKKPELELICPPSIESYFLGQKKQDDLADSLLQAIASIEFRENCRKFIVENFNERNNDEVVMTMSSRPST